VIAYERGATLAFALLFVAAVVPLPGAVDTAGEVAAVAVAMLAALVACDVVSGVVHWACDRFFAEDTPIIGTALIAPFREHHVDQLAITRRGFCEVNSSNMVAVIPLVAGASWAAPADDGVIALAVRVAVTTFALGIALTNQIHQWAHRREVPRAVRWLQRRGLILTPAHHARHHADTRARAFCITTGWSNHALDAVEAFPRLERIVRRIDGGTAARRRAVRTPRAGAPRRPHAATLRASSHRPA
jgi:plasmanylethanolamine desaturase